MEVLAVISGIISLITLICFFVLVSDVSAIRKRITNKENYFESVFNMYLFFGDKEKAKEYLFDYMKRNEKFEYAFSYPEKYRDDFLASYKEYFDKLGIDIETLKAVEEQNK